MTNKEYADSLRLIADFFEQHEEIAVPADPTYSYYTYNRDRKGMGLLARAFGTSDKEMTADLFYLSRMFGKIKFQALAWRESVCERVVTGTKKVTIEAKPATEEREVEVPIYEWRCEEPLLAVKS
jgi:hypothetical protein